MKLKYLMLICAATAFAACSHNHSDHEHEHGVTEHVEHHDNELGAHSDEGHEHDQLTENHDHDDLIHLDASDASRMGVVVDEVVPGTFHEVVSTSGVIMPSTNDVGVITASASGIINFYPAANEGKTVKAGQAVASIRQDAVSGGNANAAAKANLEAARREVERMKPLLADGIVSKRDYNAAVQAYESTKAQYSPTAAAGAVTSPISGTVTTVYVNSGAYVNSGDPIATISKSTRLQLRADLPARFSALYPTLTGAKIRIAGTDEWLNINDMAGNRVSQPNPSNSNSGYLPIYFEFDGKGKIVGGTVADIRLTGAPRQNVITLPYSAICEQQGQRYVFVRHDENNYEKRYIECGANDGERIEITRGLNPGDKVVTAGTTIVKIAQSAGLIPEGHSHQH